MIRQKNLYMANFNCTFGDSYSPMLDYFEAIVWPAFTSGYEKETTRKNKYFFKNVNIIEVEKEKYAISGVIVKQTMLEIKSLVDPDTKNIIIKDDRIPSDPFSYFIIFLENHRMVLVKNQSGSPTLKDFESLAKYTLKKAELANNYEKAININLNVGSIPSSSKIEEQIARINYITDVTLKLYPLNGDIDNIYGGLREELKALGCDEGYTTYKRPKNLSEVEDILKQGKGIYNIKVRGKGINGEKVTITDNNTASVLPVDINEDENINQNIDRILTSIDDREELREISEENRLKYIEKLPIIKYIANKIIKK